MTTTTNDDFREIQLNGKQLVFLGMAVTVVSVVIFLCGVLVGRGVRTERAGESLAAQAEAAAVPDAVPAASTSASGAPATANETLSYPQRLAGRGPASEQLKPTPAPATPPPAPKAETQKPAPAAASSSTPAASAAAASNAAAPAPASDVPGEPPGPGFTIQVTALGQRAEADRIARNLAGKGYPAYVVPPDSGAPAVFRVRVGKFKDRREAETVAARLTKEEQFKPWIR
jgi:DedD protein